MVFATLLSLNCQISGWRPHEAFACIIMRVYKGNIEEECKNLSAVICFWCPGKTDGSWSLSAPSVYPGVLQPLSYPVPGAWLPVLEDSYNMVQQCHFGSGCWERAVRGLQVDLHPLPWRCTRLRPFLLAVAWEASVFYACLCLDLKIFFSKQKTTKTRSNRPFNLLSRQISTCSRLRRMLTLRAHLCMSGEFLNL